MEWNRVENGFPETDLQVLVTDGEKLCVAINDCYSCWQPVNVDVTYDMASVVLDMKEITHWATLPELP